MNTIKLEYTYYKDGEHIKDEFTFNKTLIKEDYSLSSLFISKVEGESMQPLIKDKALVVADLSKKKYEDKNIFLIFKDNKMWIKKANILDDKEFFVSINPNFSHLKYKKEECKIVAKVLLFFNNSKSTF
ncbi:peptidase [Halarcobacter mediterraneus]|uniref:Peptidase n=1 Tax=Halarcobacter mediterraneus TaxID=2023153 RepID=A0A4Q1AQ72_9BACT|nr:S24 family peptidase [Halarcobacter mediterraneus]RXK11524.1 peptidase [Halarcobacter mediterraneus]